MGSYLRTNYRVTGAQLDAEALGGGVVQGSWGGGAGTRREYGGLIMGSFNSAVLSAVHPISAYGAMSEYYGGGLFDSGYKIFPFAIFDGSVPVGGTASVQYIYGATITGSLFYVKGIKMSQSGTVKAGALGFASNESAHFVWAGFIVSAP